jgi:hypothetical protein
MVRNKRGQQMTIGTIVAIVLGVAVLVFLIFGFSTGWKNMWDKVTLFSGTGDINVDDIRMACVGACNRGSADAFCKQQRTINFGEGWSASASCYDFATKDFGKGKIEFSKSGDGVKPTSSNVGSCPDIRC